MTDDNLAGTIYMSSLLNVDALHTNPSSDTIAERRKILHIGEDKDEKKQIRSEKLCAYTGIFGNDCGHHGSTALFWPVV